MTRINLIELLLHVIIFMLGAGIGSFLNVVIYRLPLNMSVNNPRRSQCFSCKKTIPWYENIPLFSWLQLRGKCSSCGSKIAFRYFFVELLTGVIFYAIFLKFFHEHMGRWETISTWGPQVLVFWVFAALLVAGTFIDIDHFILPHEITVTGIVLGIVASTAIPELMEVSGHVLGLEVSAVSAALGFSVLWVILLLGKLAFGRFKRAFDSATAWTITQTKEEEPPVFKAGDLEMTWDDIFFRATDKMVIDCPELTINDKRYQSVVLEVRADRLRLVNQDKSAENISLEGVKTLQGTTTQVVIPREAMGYGDLYLLAMIGAFLGWKAVFFTVVAASVLGSVIGIVPRIFGKSEWGQKLPFGPYLAAGAMLWLFYGVPFMEWYLGRFQRFD
jgi:leader peptidase (prepilin peptidase)/N-methyltransferase